MTRTTLAPARPIWFFQPLERREWWAAGLLVATTLLAYLPSLSGAFIWNDSDYVTSPALRSVAGLVRIWTEPGATEQYYPLLHSAFWVQHRLWGDHPLGYHLLTLGLHAGAAVLFALVLRRLTVPGAWLAALLFALHPVHVESVAWITEEKNTFSLVFYLAAALVYLRFDETRRPRFYAAAAIWFLLSLLCKTVTVTLPAALLVVFWWKRGRLGWRRDILPLLPWLVFGAGAGIFSSWFERHFLGARGMEFAVPMVGRGLVAGRAVWFYLGQLVWPAGLNFIYPRWSPDPAVWWQWLYPLALLALVAALWALRRRTRAPLATLLLFGGALFPVLGFVNLYGALYSWVWDHWQYLADLAPLALAGAGLEWLIAKIRRRGAAPALAIMLAAPLGVLTWAHCDMFHNDETLYRTTLARNPACWMAHLNLGVLLSQRPGRLPAALAEYETALSLNPNFAETHKDLGQALATLPGRLPEAIAQYEIALRIQPQYAEAHNNLGALLAALPGRQAEAIAHYETALQLEPAYAAAEFNLGTILAGLPGRQADAMAHYEAALRINPNLAAAHNNLGLLLASLPGRQKEAMAQYETALRINPDFAEAHNNFANTLAGFPDRLPEAIAHYEAALRINPGYLDAHYNLGVILADQPGRRTDAMAQFAAVLRIDPSCESARQMLDQLQAAGP